MRTPTRFMLALAATAGIAASAHATVTLYEEQAARAEEQRIIRAPIAGIENSRWFDYIGNINEAQKELSTDLNNVSDSEDLREVWDEYRIELRSERTHYVREMAERGYRYRQVDVID